VSLEPADLLDENGKVDVSAVKRQTSVNASGKVVDAKTCAEWRRWVASGISTQQAAACSEFLRDTIPEHINGHCSHTHDHSDLLDPRETNAPIVEYRGSKWVPVTPEGVMMEWYPECPECETDLLVDRDRNEPGAYQCQGCGESFRVAPAPEPVAYRDVNEWYLGTPYTSRRVHASPSCRGFAPATNRQTWSPERAKRAPERRCEECAVRVGGVPPREGQ